MSARFVAIEIDLTFFDGVGSYFPLTAGAYPVPVCPCSPRRIRRIHVAVSIRNRHRTTSLRSALLLLPEEPAVSFLHLTRGVRAALQPERRDQQNRATDQNGASYQRERGGIHLAARPVHAAPVRQVVRVRCELENTRGE